jgi:hypothetical protein
MSCQLVKNEKYNQDYRGHAEKCTWTFTVNLPDQLGAGWTAERLAQAHITELHDQGSIILEFRLYEDKTSGTFTTDYRVEVVASASPLWWNLIILGVIGAIIVIGVAWTIQNIEDIAEYAPGAATALSVGLMLIPIAAVVLGVMARPKRRKE